MVVGLLWAQEEAPQDDFETSELLMYKAMVLEEGGKLDEALAHLKASKVGAEFRPKAMRNIVHSEMLLACLSLL